MSKIQSLRVNNFKFFRNSKPIELNGKHLLLYGENGSGKSSIYYGLYTLLESASKTPAVVQKYFTPDNQQSLVNIYADTANGAGNTGASISVIDSDGKNYVLSYNDTACCGNSDLIESSRASDFMNYVSLFRFQLFRNSESVDLHDVFLQTILPNITFPKFTFKGTDLYGAYDMFLQYKEGPGTIENENGRTILVYKNSPDYNQYLSLERHFNSSLKSLIDYINANVNAKITEFDYDFKVEFEYVPASHDKKDTWIDFHEFGIKIKLVEYNRKQLSNTHPNTFLNEAKMAALAFSIRWTILDYRLQGPAVANALKVLVLDDVMISLDMANRNQLIHIIIDKLSPEFQILFLTHDMQVFNCMKQELMFIYNRSKEEELMDDGWLLLDLFETPADEGFEPICQPYKSNFERAKRYYDGKDAMVDLIASGNAIRQAFEGAFKDLFMRANITKNKTTGDPIDFDNLMTADCIGLARDYKDRLGVTEDFLVRIDKLKQCLMNPSSHHNPGRNFYRHELDEAFKLYLHLCKFEIKVLVPSGSDVQFSIKTVQNVTHVYTVTLKNNLLAYRLVDNNSFDIFWHSGKFSIEDSSQPGVMHHEKNKSLMQLYDETWDYHIGNGNVLATSKSNVIETILYQGRKLLELL